MSPHPKPVLDPTRGAYCTQNMKTSNSYPELRQYSAHVKQELNLVVLQSISNVITGANHVSQHAYCNAFWVATWTWPNYKLTTVSELLQCHDSHSMNKPYHTALIAGNSKVWDAPGSQPDLQAWVGFCYKEREYWNAQACGCISASVTQN